MCARLKKLSLTRCRLITDLGLLTVLRGGSLGAACEDARVCCRVVYFTHSLVLSSSIHSTATSACPDLEELLLTDAVRLTPATFGNIGTFFVLLLLLLFCLVFFVRHWRAWCATQRMCSLFAWLLLQWRGLVS